MTVTASLSVASGGLVIPWSDIQEQLVLASQLHVPSTQHISFQIHTLPNAHCPLLDYFKANQVADSSNLLKMHVLLCFCDFNGHYLEILLS